MKTAELDKPIEVTRYQYTQMINVFRGIVAHRQENGRYYIKRLYPVSRKEVEQFLNVS